MSIERRRSPRVGAHQPVVVSAGGVSVEGRLHDVCREAALVACPGSWPVGTEVALTLDLLGRDRPLQVLATVIRVSGAEGAPQGVALLFKDLTPAAATDIDLYVERGAPTA